MSIVTPLLSAVGATVNDAMCDRAAKLLYARTGLMLGEHKAVAIQRALVRFAGLYAEGDEARFLSQLEQDSGNVAWESFINTFTINHTAFFREPHHFQKLSEFFQSRASGCAVWCAAASTGEEPYSIAMVADEVYGSLSARANCTIYASDIDTDALAVARQGIYSLARAESVGEDRLKRHFLRGIDSQEGKVRLRPPVQGRVTFAPLNLNDASWSVPGPFDVIFCRNTMIYFDRETQERLIARFARNIRSGGLLFVGHSENISPLTTEFTLLGQTVYQRK